MLTKLRSHALRMRCITQGRRASPGRTAGRVGLHGLLRLTESPTRRAARCTCAAASSLASVASSAFAAGSRLSQGPTASSTSAACATACALGVRRGSRVVQADLPHPHPPRAKGPAPGDSEVATPAQPSRAQMLGARSKRAWNTALPTPRRTALLRVSGARLSAASMADRASLSRPSRRSTSLLPASACTSERLRINAARVRHDGSVIQLPRTAGRFVSVHAPGMERCMQVSLIHALQPCH